MQRRFLRKRGTAGKLLPGASGRTPLRLRFANPPPPKGGGFALLTGRCRKAPPSGESGAGAPERAAREQTERFFLHTLPKKAGNISLSLREWGLFCIESRLQGAGGI